MLEVRRMLAADMPFASDALDQELDAPSDHLSITTLTAATESTGSGAVELRIDASIDQTEADVETFVDTAAADQVFELAGDHNADGVVDHDDYFEWKANFGTVGTPAAGNDGVVDAAAYIIWRDNLGASTVASPSDSFNAPGGRSDEPAEDVSISFVDDDAGIETPVDAAIADHVPQPLADTSLAGETPVDTDVVDQAFELDDAAAGNLDTSSPSVSLDGSEGNASDAAQPSIDTGTDGFPGGLLETETGVETTRPEDTEIVFGDMDYDDVKTKDDIPDLRKVSYGNYETARALGDSHEKAAKAAGVEADGKWGEIFKRVYENDNGK
jgi:hypothetical protein